MSEQGNAAPASGSGLTPAEEAYFASGGTVTEGLNAETPAAPAPAPAVPAPAAPAAPEATAQPAPAPEEDEGEEIAGAGGQKRRMVDYRALKETRGKLKELQDRYESDRNQWVKDRETQARLDERLRLLNEALTPDPTAVQPEQEAPPNPEEDIFGFVRHLGKQIEAIQGQTREVAGTVAANDEETRLRSAYQSDARRFAAATPDFGAAYAHLLKARGDMLTMQGYDEKQISEILLNEERGLVQRAFQSGKSPAEIVYGMAKSFGYQTTAPNPNPNPAPVPAVPAAPAPAATPAAAASDEIARIQAAQAASRSLSNGGGAAAAPMTVESLANMSQAEFNQFVRRNPEIARQLMGG